MGLLRGSRTSSNNSGGLNNKIKSNGGSLSLQPNDDKQLNLSAAVDGDENNLTTSHDNSVELKLLLRKLVETTTTADASKEGAAVQSWNGKENNNSKKNDNNDDDDDDDDFVVNNDNSDGATHQKDDDITKLSNATTASQQQQQLGQQQQMLDLSHFTKATTLCQDDPTFVQHHSDNQKSCSDLFGEEEDKVGGGGEVNEEKKKTTRMIVCETDIINDELSSAAEGGEEKERKKVKDFCKRSCGLCNNNDLAGEIVINDEGESGGGKSNNTSEVGGEEEVEEDDDDDEEGGGVVETTLDEFKTTTTNDGTTTLTKATKKEGEEETQIDEGTDEKKDEKTALLAEEGEEEKNENGDDDDDGESVEDVNQTKKENNVIGIKSAEMEKITLKEVDEDDAFIPDNDEVKGDDDGTAKKQVKKGTEGGNDKSEVKDYMSAQEEEEKEEKDTETHAGSEEEVSVTVTANEEEVSATDKIYDEQQLVKEMESKLETALEEGFVDEDTAEKIEEEMEEAFEEGVGRVFEKELEEELGENGGSNSVSSAAVVEDEDDDDDDEKASNKKASSKGEELEAATTTEEVVVASSNAEDDSSALCQDDSNFNYKGYDGFNCQYIKENKPDKCDKLHDGVKVGLVSCPVSCAMVDECMALQKQLNNGAVEEEKRVGEQSTESQEEEAPASISNIDESATEQKDELQLEKEMESELETALEKGTIDENTAEKLDEEMFEALEEGVGEVFEKELEEELGLAGGDNEQEVAADQASSKEGEKEEATKVDATDHLTTIGLSFNENASTIELDGPPVVANLTIGEDDLTFCQDDPDFKYKGYEGFNCGYIKENKPDKCDKLHDGEKVGVVSCPVSCGMVDECKALQESKVDAALENLLENKETVSSATLEGDTVATGTTAEETVEDGSEETLKGQTSVTSDENNVDADDTLRGLCQDDPDFNFKGYAGFNCDYIKENKPEKCEKLHEGEKVGTVFCPVSCNMIDECMTLQKQKGSADDTQQLSSAENETVNVAAEDNVSKEIVDPIEASTVINEGEAVTKMNEGELVDTEEVVLDENSAMTDEDETKDEINVEIIPTKGVCQDDPDFIFKGYDGLNCEYIKNNKPEKCDKLHFGEKIGVVSCPVSCDMVDECMARQQVKESSVAEIVAKENEEIGDETGSKVEDEVQVEKQVTTIPSKSQEDDDLEAKEEQGLDGKELEMEIEAKLEKAVEEGELDEEEAEELEYEMDEALEEGAGEIFEEELDKELRCKDDPEFLYMDGDLERDCLWIHQNERCDHVHKDTGKVIGKFFCPETCGMKEECEKVTAADASLHTPEVEDKTSGKEGGDAFEAVPKGTKSMEDEIGMESEIENGNIYGAENLETISGGDTATNSFAYQNDDAYADKDGNFNSEGDDVMYNKYQDTANLNQWDNMDMDGLPLSQEYNQKPNFQPTNVVDNYNWQDEENEREGNSFEKIDYDENWLDDDGGFPFGFLILLFIGVGVFIFRKSQNQSSRQQDHSRGGYQRVGRRIDVQEHNKRY